MDGGIYNKCFSFTARCIYSFAMHITRAPRHVLLKERKMRITLFVQFCLCRPTFNLIFRLGLVEHKVLWICKDRHRKLQMCTKDGGDRMAVQSGVSERDRKRRVQHNTQQHNNARCMLNFTETKMRGRVLFIF